MKGTKKIKQSEVLKEEVEGQGTGEFKVSGGGDIAVAPTSLGIQTGAEVENQRTEALGYG